MPIIIYVDRLSSSGRGQFLANKLLFAGFMANSTLRLLIISLTHTLTLTDISTSTSSTTCTPRTCSHFRVCTASPIYCTSAPGATQATTTKSQHGRFCQLTWTRFSQLSKHTKPPPRIVSGYCDPARPSGSALNQGIDPALNGNCFMCYAKRSQTLSIRLLTGFWDQTGKPHVP